MNNTANVEINRVAVNCYDIVVNQKPMGEIVRASSDTDDDRRKSLFVIYFGGSKIGGLFTIANAKSMVRSNAALWMRRKGLSA